MVRMSALMTETCLDHELLGLLVADLDVEEHKLVLLRCECV